MVAPIAIISHLCNQKYELFRTFPAESFKSEQLEIACCRRIKFKRIVISICCVVNSMEFCVFSSSDSFVHPAFSCFILTLTIWRHNHYRHTVFFIFCHHCASCCHLRSKWHIQRYWFRSVSNWVRDKDGGEMKKKTQSLRHRILSSICKYFCYRIALYNTQTSNTSTSMYMMYVSFPNHRQKNIFKELLSLFTFIIIIITVISLHRSLDGCQYTRFTSALGVCSKASRDDDDAMRWHYETCDSNK